VDFVTPYFSYVLGREWIDLTICLYLSNSIWEEGVLGFPGARCNG
jgi:hypothetical protein